MTGIQMDTFQRPAPYWLRRAEKCKQAGDLRRAAALERHAARIDPGYAAGPASYALTLRQLHCYEASNREALAALAYDPTRASLYGLIGQNLIALGRRQEGLDAFSLYFEGEDEVIAPWDGEICDMEEDCWRTPVKRRARLRGLMNIAQARLARGDMDGAARALRRAQRPPFCGPYARWEVLAAQWCAGAGRPQQALEHMKRAVRLRPRDAMLAAEAASLFKRLGHPKEAASALMRAAACAVSPGDELMTCLAAEQLGAQQAACAMLEKSLHRRESRYPVLFNLAVCHLKLGRLDEAVRQIHLCRELDPDDMFGEVLFNRIMALKESAPAKEDVVREARRMAYYGVLLSGELELYFGPIMEALGRGVEALAALIETDDKLRGRFLYMLRLLPDRPALLLPAVCGAMRPEAAQRLLREVLLLDCSGALGKRLAMAMLTQMGAPAPYAVWQEGRLGYVDPAKPPPAAPSFYQRMLTRRIYRAAALAQDEGFVPWALARVKRLDERARLHMLADPACIWPLALSVRYRYEQGLSPQYVDSARMNQLRVRMLGNALRVLRAARRKQS